MHEHPPVSHRIIFLAIFAASCLLLTISYYDNSFLSFNSVYITDQEDFYVAAKNTTNAYNSTPTIITTTIPHNITAVTTSPPKNEPHEELDFIVYSSKCKMLDLDPFNRDAKKFFNPEKYTPCRTHKLLTYVKKVDNIATLHIDDKVIPSYAKKGVSCCYSNVTRKHNEKDPDGGITTSTCKTFQNNITIHNDPVLVKCAQVDKPGKSVYENVHATITLKDEVQKKMENFDNTTKPISVLFVGIDSISRLNFIRSLPNTYKFVEENGWVPLKGYNKMDDNTFPNLMAILTGYNQTYAYNVCDPKTVGKLDNCSMLWYDFRKLGFITAYAEDEAFINTFNYRKKGFTIPPVDYYFRPYILATETLDKKYKDGMKYCTGPESAGERIMNIAKDFTTTFKAYPTFGFFWMNSFSHNKINSPTGMDDKVKDLLEYLSDSGVTERSIVIFLSDHGMRFGDIRQTDTGWLEERLPFIYVSFPKWFQQSFPKEYDAFKNNTYKLTCPYDLHMTFKHILVLSGYNYTVTPSESCPKCKSLFEDIDPERSCEDAGIAQHWCTCAGYTKSSLNKEVEKKVSNFVLSQIHSTILSRKGDKKCAKFSVEKIMDMKISRYFSYKNETYILLRLSTKPNAVFETTLSFTGDLKSSNLSLSGDISRLDSYNEHSKCVSDAYLKKYCYCR